MAKQKLHGLGWFANEIATKKGCNFREGRPRSIYTLTYILCTAGDDADYEPKGLRAKGIASESKHGGESETPHGLVPNGHGDL